MQLIKQEENYGQAVKFKLWGFPEEETVKTALANFYKTSPETPKEFAIFNMFDELIFTGQVLENGEVSQLESKDRKEDPDKFKKED